jgi:hypothetical protein
MRIWLMKMTAWTSLFCAVDFHFSWRTDEKMDYIFGSAGRFSTLIDRHVSTGHTHPGPHRGPAVVGGESDPGSIPAKIS